ncbi:MAG: ATP-binding protein [Candidatus Shikimatogenerans sp. AspAUS03]|uniref:ATP-binding protein n=1 Tax=Candidatus Shikimatogenerans sp. AspAUS03 TaxID=3158563 RepID=A0AAU7QT31_9FLAO
MNKIFYLDNKLKNKIYIFKKIKNINFIILELLKNSLDAKSKFIKIYFKKYGLSYIKISDNGIGMNLKDLLLCYRKYTTSKIKNFKDLKNKKFYGYKGESLFWISCVSRIIIFTKSKNNKLGKMIHIEYGKLINVKYLYKKNNGTTIIIKDLFFNISLYMKYYKYTIKDFNKLIIKIKIIILPLKIKLKIFNNKTKILFYKSSNNYKQNIYNLFNINNIKSLIYKKKNNNINLYFSFYKKNKYFLYINNKILINKYIYIYLKNIFKIFFLKQKIVYYIFIYIKNINYLKLNNYEYLYKYIFIIIKKLFYKKYIFLKKKNIQINLNFKNKNIYIKYLYELYNKYFLYIYINNLFIINKKLAIKNILLNIFKKNKLLFKQNKIIIKNLNINYLKKHIKLFLINGIKFLIIKKNIKIIYYPKIFIKKYIIFFFKKFQYTNNINKNIYYYIYNYIFKKIKYFYYFEKIKFIKDLFLCTIYTHIIKDIIYKKINYNFIKKNIFLININ